MEAPEKKAAPARAADENDDRQNIPHCSNFVYSDPLRPIASLTDEELQAAKLALLAEIAGLRGGGAP